jgi:tripartite-type tricarboxylate transporter receptor subunit TctC
VVRIHRRQALTGLIALAAGLRLEAAYAQPSFPTRPLRVIVPFAAGGVGDTLIRILAPGLQERLGQKLVIEVRPGAAGYVGASEVARAAPDGYTILVAPSGNFVTNQFLMRMSFDPIDALPPIAKIAEIPLVLCINPAVPAHDFAEFIQYARAHPGVLNFGSPGNGSINHLLVEKLKQATGIEITHVPYRGAAPAALAALANEIQLFPMGLAVVGSHLRDGKLTALAVASVERLSVLPKVPTLIEEGYPTLAISNWWAVAAPKGTPEPIVTSLNRAFVQVLADASVVKSLAALGIGAPTQTREQFVAGLRPEAAQWSEVIRRGNLTLD